MRSGPGRGRREDVILDGGPMDGTRRTIDARTDQLSVVMTDGQRHRYLRTDDVQTFGDGRPVPVFRWNGRVIGPD